MQCASLPYPPYETPHSRLTRNIRTTRTIRNTFAVAGRSPAPR